MSRVSLENIKKKTSSQSRYELVSLAVHIFFTQGIFLVLGVWLASFGIVFVGAQFLGASSRLLGFGLIGIWGTYFSYTFPDLLGSRISELRREAANSIINGSEVGYQYYVRWLAFRLQERLAEALMAPMLFFLTILYWAAISTSLNLSGTHLQVFSEPQYHISDVILYVADLTLKGALFNTIDYIGINFGRLHANPGNTYFFYLSWAYRMIVSYFIARILIAFIWLPTKAEVVGEELARPD